MAWPAGQGPGRIKNGGSVTREYGSETLGWTYGSDRIVKIFVPHFNVHQIASTMEVTLNNQ